MAARAPRSCGDPLSRGLRSTAVSRALAAPGAVVRAAE